MPQLVIVQISVKGQGNNRGQHNLPGTAQEIPFPACREEDHSSLKLIRQLCKRILRIRDSEFVRVKKNIIGTRYLQMDDTKASTLLMHKLYDKNTAPQQLGA